MKAVWNTFPIRPEACDECHGEHVVAATDGRYEGVGPTRAVALTALRAEIARPVKREALGRSVAGLIGAKFVPSRYGSDSHERHVAAHRLIAGPPIPSRHSSEELLREMEQLRVMPRKHVADNLADYFVFPVKYDGPKWCVDDGSIICREHGKRLLSFRTGDGAFCPTGGCCTRLNGDEMRATPGFRDKHCYLLGTK